MNQYYEALEIAVREVDAPVVLEVFGKDGERIALARRTSRGVLWDGRERTKLFEGGAERVGVAYERQRFLIDWPEPLEPGDVPDQLPGWGKRSGNQYFSIDVVRARIASAPGRRTKMTLVDANPR